MALVVQQYPAGAQILREGNQFVPACTRCRRRGTPVKDYNDADWAASQHAVHVDDRRNCLPF